MRLARTAAPARERGPPITMTLRTILAFALVLTAAAGIAFGVLPALRACGQSGVKGLQEGARAGKVGGLLVELPVSIEQRHDGFEVVVRCSVDR